MILSILLLNLIEEGGNISMNLYTIIGEVILFVVGIPLFAFQTFEMLQAFVQILADLSQFTDHK
jgi:hypothetical protein